MGVPSTFGQGHDGSPVQRLIARLFDAAAIAPRAVPGANGELDRTGLRLENCLLSLRDAPVLDPAVSNSSPERIVRLQSLAERHLDEGLDQYVEHWNEAVRALYPGIAQDSPNAAYTYVFTPGELERLAAIPIIDTIALASDVVFENAYPEPLRGIADQEDTVYTRL